MAGLATTHPTMLDVLGRTDESGNIMDVAELLAETNEILDDMVVVEANATTTHKTTVRSGLPPATWRKLNYGVQPSKSTTVPIVDTLGMLESYAEVDKALADLNGNSAAWRLSEDRAFIESMNQSMASTLFYGDTGVYNERFMGLSPRFNTKLGAANGENIIVADAGAAGSDQSSIWLVVWGPNTVHGLYPKGSMAGLSMTDLGEQTLYDANNGRYQGYRTHYKWDLGLTVRDWRYVVRIANVDTSALTKNAATGADLIDSMIQAIELIPNLGMGRPAFYVSRTVRSFLRRQIVNKSNALISLDEVAGKHVVTFDGIPVRRSDAILNTEAVIV